MDFKVGLLLLLGLAAGGLVALNHYLTSDEPLHEHANHTERGEHPVVTPMLTIVDPPEPLANEPVVIQVEFQDFNFRPDEALPEPDLTMGYHPQTTGNGLANGHIHMYLNRVGGDVPSDTFCLSDQVELYPGGTSGLATAICDGVPAGEYRLAADFNTDAHDQIFKSNPRDMPTSDVRYITVRESDDP